VRAVREAFHFLLADRHAVRFVQTVKTCRLRAIQPLLGFLSIVSCLAICPPLQGAKPLLISGTYQKGSNVMEPRPKKSAYLQTVHGGTVVIGDQAGYYLFVRVIKKPSKDLFMRIYYENPDGGQPFTNTRTFGRDAEEFHLGSPDFVKNLTNYATYSITVKVFESADAQAPTDVLTQKIRSYVDTHGKVKLFRKLTIKPS
jgi:hypothetical protein